MDRFFFRLKAIVAIYFALLFLVTLRYSEGGFLPLLSLSLFFTAIIMYFPLKALNPDMNIFFMSAAAFICTMLNQSFHGSMLNIFLILLPVFILSLLGSGDRLYYLLCFAYLAIYYTFNVIFGVFAPELIHLPFVVVYFVMAAFFRRYREALFIAAEERRLLDECDRKIEHAASEVDRIKNLMNDSFRSYFSFFETASRGSIYDSDFFTNILKELVSIASAKSCALFAGEKEEVKLKLMAYDLAGESVTSLDEIYLDAGIVRAAHASGEKCLILSREEMKVYSQEGNYLAVFEGKYYLIFKMNAASLNSSVVLVFDDESFYSRVFLLDILASIANFLSIVIENAKLYGDMKATYRGAINALAKAMESKDLYTKGHLLRVSTLARLIAKRMKLPDPRIESLEVAAYLHDIGKIGISEEILSKPDKLDVYEYEEIKKHAAIGADILSPLKTLGEVLPIIRYHHERYDGKGYPDGLKGENIPIEARILSVVDTFDALTSDRVYRKNKLNFAEAMEYIDKLRGEQLDPSIIDIMKEVVKDYGDRIFEAS